MPNWLRMAEARTAATCRNATLWPSVEEWNAAASAYRAADAAVDAAYARRARTRLSARRNESAACEAALAAREAARAVLMRAARGLKHRRETGTTRGEST